jgi:hypothetical protein
MTGQSEMRQIFEAMHKGRNINRHYLRGTYVYPAMAALWNQHVKSWNAAIEAAAWECKEIAIKEQQTVAQRCVNAVLKLVRKA